MHQMFVGMPIGGGEVTLGLAHGDKQDEFVCESSKDKGIKGLAPPCLEVRGFGGLVINGPALLWTSGGEQIRVIKDDG